MPVVGARIRVAIGYKGMEVSEKESIFIRSHQRVQGRVDHGRFRAWTAVSRQVTGPLRGPL